MHTTRKKDRPHPLDLMFELCDFCIAVLSPNAWKIVSFVARQSLGIYASEWEEEHNPRKLVIRDLRAMIGEKIPLTAVEPQATPGLAVVSENTPKRFVPISLQQICAGIRKPKGFQSCGTGLSKSSAAAAINEAVQQGILERRHRTQQGRDLASHYAINWERVSAIAQTMKTSRAKVLALRRHPR